MFFINFFRFVGATKSEMKAARFQKDLSDKTSWRSKRRALRHASLPAFILGLSLAGLEVASIAHAQQIVDPNAPIQFQPGLGLSSNGTSVVDIVTPSAGGLSHNMFQQYDVDATGVILNNSGIGGTSVIGGNVNANANLTGGSASIILNEVTGSTASNMIGATEVFGQSADVIVANPNGVTCAGCSFINTGKVTLSSGAPTPDYNTGIVSYAVTTGTVEISGTGISGYNGGAIGALDLIGRQINLDGEIRSAGDVRARAGAINYDQGLDTAVAIANPPAISGNAISSTTNGTILASTVSVLSFDLNIGVELLGDITSYGGNTQIVSAGDLTIGLINANGALALNSAQDLTVVSGSVVTSQGGTTLTVGGALDNDGRIESAQTIDATIAGIITNSGEIVSQTLLDLEAGGYVGVGNASMLLASNIDLSVSGSVDNAGRIQGNSGLSIDFTGTTGDFRNRTGAMVAGPLLVFLVPDQFNNDGTFLSSGSFGVQASSMTGGVNAVINAASALIDIDGNANVTGLINSLTTVLLDIDGVLTHSASTVAANRIDIMTTGNLTNNGVFAADNLVNAIIGGDILQNVGSGMFSDLLYVEANGGAGNINNRGMFEGLTGIQFVANDLRNSSNNIALPAIIAAANLDFDLTGDLINGTKARILASDTVTIDAATAQLDFGRLNSVQQGEFIYGDNLLVNLTAGGMEIGRGGVLQMDGILSINVFGDVENYGTIAVPGNLSIVSTNGSIINGEISATNAGGGTIFTYGSLLLQAGVDIENNGSTIEAGGDIFLDAGGDILNRRSNTIWATISSTNLGGRWRRDEKEQIETSPAAIINAGGRLTIDAGGLTSNVGSELAATGDIIINTTDFENIERARQTRSELWRYQRSGLQTSRRWVLKSVDLGAVATPSLVYTSGNLVINATGNVDITGTQVANQQALYGSTITIGLTDPNLLSPTPSQPQPDIDLLAYLTTPVNFAAPGSPYLNALNPPTGGYALTPDWILGEVGDNRSDLTFLADPTLEAQVIRRALLSEIGVAYLDPDNANDDAQRQALYQATVDFLKANPGLTLGDQLTEEQRNAITVPLLWYEEREIDGKLVLVPTLLLPKDNLDAYTVLAGGVLQADSIYIDGDHVHNTGYILAKDDLTILADTFVNELRTALDQQVVKEKKIVGSEWKVVTFNALQHGGVLGGADIMIQTQDDFLNLGGTISGTESVNIASINGNIINEAQEGEFVVNWDPGSWGGLFGAASWDIGTEFAPGQILSGGEVNLIAQNGEIRNIGSTIGGFGDVTLSAKSLIEQDVKTASFIVSETVSCSLTGCSGNTEGETVIQQSEIRSEIGNIVIDVSDGDFVNIGSKILASFGDVSISAEDIIFTAATAEVIEDSFTLGFGPTGIAYQASEWNKVQTALSEVAGQNISLNATGDINGEGAIITAVNDLTMQAGGSILFDSHQNDLWHETWGFSLSISFPGSSLIGALESGGGIEDVALAYANSNPVGAALVGLANAEDGLSIGMAAMQVGMASFDMLGGLAGIYRNPDPTVGGLSGVGDSLLSQLNPFSDFFDGGGISFGVGVSYNEQETAWTESFQSQLSAGGDLTMIAGQDISLVGGTQASAVNDVLLQAGNDVNIAAGADTYASEGMSAGLSVNFGPGSLGLGVNFSENESESTTYTGADLTAGDNLTINAGNDLNVIGGDVSGDTVDIAVGGDLTVESVQDTNSSDSSGFGLNVGIGAAGITSLGVNVSSSESEGAWTNDGLATISGTGETNVIVQGDTTVTGGAIVSEEGDLTFETSSLTVNDLNDYQESSGFNFGITLNSSFFNQDKPSETNSPYRSPFMGELTIGMNGSIKEGITYSVVGEGQILIGDDPGNQILAEVHRDLDGRQVVTVEDEWGFQITIPLVDFNQLAFEAGRIGDFFNALTTPVPPNVTAQGPRAEQFYRNLIAQGFNENVIDALRSNGYFDTVVQAYETYDRALAVYGHPSLIPDGLIQAIVKGAELVYDAGDWYAVIPCNTSGNCLQQIDVRSAESISGFLQSLDGRVRKGRGMTAQNQDKLEEVLWASVAQVEGLWANGQYSEAAALAGDLGTMLGSYWAMYDNIDGMIEQICNALPIGGQSEFWMSFPAGMQAAAISTVAAEESLAIALGGSLNLAARRLGGPRTPSTIQGVNIGGTNIRSVNAADANANHDLPPYNPSKPVFQFEADGTTEYIRVYTDGTTGQTGAWMMTANDITGLTPQQIKDKFDLPYMPTHVTNVAPPRGTPITTGTVNSGSFGGSGGGIQFELMDRLPSSAFTNPRPL